MSGFATLPLEELLRDGGFVCECGKRHQTQLKIFKSGSGVIRTLPEVIAKLGVKKPFVVYDKNTYKAAGMQVEEILRNAGIEFKSYMVPGEHIEPDEFSVGAITMAMDPSCDILMAVGSGVLNDLCKVVGYAAGKPSMVVGTAPSMDGYASNSSSMHVDGVKTSLYNACPVAIIADSDIISQAPMRMLWSGLGDMIAKYVSLCEWRIANIVIDEYYCEEVASLVRRSLVRCVENATRLAERDPEVIQAVTEGLVLSGVAMGFAECSRPASGLEHYFSHMWEMMAMERGTTADMHGIQVGVGTLKTLELYDWIRTLKPDAEKGKKWMESFDEEAWTEMVKRIFGKTAPQILEIEKKVRKNDPAKHAKRLERIVTRWDEILKAIDEELPDRIEMENIMRQLGMPMYPADLGISDEDVKEAYTGSREIRDKYLSCTMLWDMGLAEEARERV